MNDEDRDQEMKKLSAVINVLAEKYGIKNTVDMFEETAVVAKSLSDIKAKVEKET